MNKFVSWSMKLRTVLMPPVWVQLLAELVRDGYYLSISEAIRAAVRDLLVKHGKIERRRP